MHRFVRHTFAKLNLHSKCYFRNGHCQRRPLLTLAIETSCDDTSVAILEKHGSPAAAKLHFHEKVTANNLAYGGVHPLVALESHQQNLAKLVDKAIDHLPDANVNDTAKGKNSNSDGSKKQKNGSSMQQWNNDVIWNNRLAHFAKKPDFVTVTRGPGMRSNLSTGIDTAKGLATAWQVPLVGVNHMQAHALTPRLVDALDRREKEEGDKEATRPGIQESPDDTTASSEKDKTVQPSYPFLSLLVSGGHTLLVHSRTLTAHDIWASTTDIAIGEAIDKIARHILPADVISKAQTTMYGALLERFAFEESDFTDNHHHHSPYNYTPPTNRTEVLTRHTPLTPSHPYRWSFTPPLTQTKGGLRARMMEFSFAGLVTAADNFMNRRIAPDGRITLKPRDLATEGEVGVGERRAMAREAMRVAFEHLATRIMLGLERSGAMEGKGVARREVKEKGEGTEEVKTLVLSGGVAANGFLRYVLKTYLAARGAPHVKLLFPPPALCTDNAAMIAWAGMEMFEAGWTSEMSISGLRKWSLDATATDGGILGVGGWVRRVDCGKNDRGEGRAVDTV